MNFIRSPSPRSPSPQRQTPRPQQTGNNGDFLAMLLTPLSLPLTTAQLNQIPQPPVPQSRFLPATPEQMYDLQQFAGQTQTSPENVLPERYQHDPLRYRRFIEKVTTPAQQIMIDLMKTIYADHEVLRDVILKHKDKFDYLIKLSREYGAIPYDYSKIFGEPYLLGDPNKVTQSTSI
jgi:hypothetical protein